MKTAAALAAFALLLVLLTWMGWRSFNGKAEQFDRAFGELDRFATVEAALQRDVLSARAGVLRNYDPLVRHIAELEASTARLRDITARDPATDAVIDGLDRALSQQESLVEQFKTNNALLQNSVSYFVKFTSRVDPALDEGGFAETVRSLVAAVLRLTLDTSDASTRQVQARLDDLARTQAPNDPMLVSALLAHGRLLQGLLPATDRLLRQLLATATRPELDQLHGALMTRELASRAVGRQSRFALYVVSLLLVGLLAYVGFKLRERAETLRRRAGFERAIANSSIRFVGAREQDLDDAIVRALGEMAACIGAERAYFLASSTSMSNHSWCASGVSFPPGWPDAALGLVDRFGRTVPNGLMAYVPHASRVRAGEDRETLGAAGLRSWACIASDYDGGGRTLLGFDAVTAPSRIGVGGELGLLQMGLSAIATALNQRTLKQERGRLEARLQQARRLETIGAFASGITHNLNNILAAILGYAEMGGEREADRTNYPAILQQIRGAGQRAREVVDQILIFARRREPQLQTASVRRLVEESVSLLRASLPETVELVVSNLDNALVLGEPAQLQQVILNLGNNAAQAMSNAGLIELDTELRSLPRSQSLSHGMLSPGSYICITVVDHGSGIDPAMQERIFEPFFTTRWNGSGLGLATTREIVTEHGGAMHVRSNLGLGSRFEVWLPLAAESAPAPERPAIGMPVGNGETVLLVEQDIERLLRDEEILAALGFEPVGYLQAAEAEAAFLAQPERFDVVLIGHLDTSASALRLSATLRNAVPSLPILLAAASAGRFGADKLADAGISDVVRWPIAASEIVNSIRDCLGRSRGRVLVSSSD